MNILFVLCLPLENHNSNLKYRDLTSLALRFRMCLRNYFLWQLWLLGAWYIITVLEVFSKHLKTMWSIGKYVLIFGFIWKILREKFDRFSFCSQNKNGFYTSEKIRRKNPIERGIFDIIITCYIFIWGSFIVCGTMEGTLIIYGTEKLDVMALIANSHGVGYSIFALDITEDEESIVTFLTTANSRLTITFAGGGGGFLYDFQCPSLEKYDKTTEDEVRATPNISYVSGSIFSRPRTSSSVVLP